MQLNIFAGIHLYGISGGTPFDIANRYLWFRAILRLQFQKKPGIFHMSFTKKFLFSHRFRSWLLS